MKTIYIFCILFLAFGGQALAQLKCRYCDVTPTGQPTKVSVGIEYVEILSGPGTFQGNIMLKDSQDHTSHFDLITEGHYRVNGEISSAPGTTLIGLTVSAPGAENWGGHRAGLTLGGEYANNYTGPTYIRSGYLACNKPEGTVSIPGDIILSKEANSQVESGLWFGTSHQLSGTGKIIFERGNVSSGMVNLNGTTQTIAGLKGNQQSDIVENIATNNPTSIPGLPKNTTTKAVLIIRGTTGERTHFGGGNAKLRSNTGNGGLEIQVEGNKQSFQVAYEISDMTYKTGPNGLLELYAYGNRPDVITIGANITLNGNGTFKKTGGGMLNLGNTIMSQSGGRFLVSEAILRNDPATRYPTDNANKNKSVLHLDGGWSTFDLYGVDSFFGGLTGGGRVENNWKGNSILELDLNNNSEHIFSGEIKDNDNNQPVSNTETGKGKVTLRKKGSGTQILTGTNRYTGKTMIDAGRLKLQGGGKLGNGTYSSYLEIANSANPAAVFEYNGPATHVFNSSINSYSTTTPAANPQRGIFRQSGTGRTAIYGTHDFTGNIEITGGILAGTADLRKTNSVTVAAQGAIAGGLDEFGGGVLTVGNLTFTAATSTLLVYPRSNSVFPSAIPGTVEVKNSDGTWGTVTAPQGFTVAIDGRWVSQGYVLRCSNGLRDNLPLPVAISKFPASYHQSEYSYCFQWTAEGLHMSVSESGTQYSGLYFNKPADKIIYSGEPQAEMAFTPSSGGGVPTAYQWRLATEAPQGTHFSDGNPNRDEIGLADYTTDWTRTSIPAYTAVTITDDVVRKRTIQVTGRRTSPTSSCMVGRKFTVTVEPTPYLTCDNCSFTRPGSTDLVTGTAATPATIITGVNGTGDFTGDITLLGACNFTVRKKGNFTLSGQILGTGPLTYQMPDAGGQGKLAGITLSGTGSNTYTGLTSVTKGYVICHKTNNAVAIPNDVKISAVSGNMLAHLWCKADNQFGSTSVVDVSDGLTWSMFHLNGTTQSIAGLKANNHRGVVENWEDYFRAAPLANETATTGAIINIAVAAGNNCIFGGGATIRRGTTTQALTVNVTGGTQIIDNPQSHIVNVTLTSSGEATLEFNTTVATTNYTLGNGVTFKGNGTIKKTGPGVLVMANSTVLKTGGQIWVAEGTLRNEGANIYSNNTESNQAILRLEAAAGSPAPVFDLRGNNSIFGGLTGNGVVQNNFGPAGTSPGGGYNELFLTLTESHTFAGVIRNNVANAPPESGGGEGKGGIALKIEGNNRTLSLSGVNLYTGSTAISSGKLLLTGEAQLGGGTYPGALEISNAAEAASQATFEHNGISIQIFAGNITATGEGAVKGIFLQSGTGKSILNGTKTFSGNITITNGFLGGAGSLANINSLNLEGTGSIGGGDGAGGNGALFTVKGLAFKSATTKLIVAPMPDNSPALLDVQSLPTATNANSFTVDILGGANLQSGYILRYPDNVQRPDNLPAPVIGENSTGKEVRLGWNNLGLWMQVSAGTITLSVHQGAVCPKGSNPGNPEITVYATYSNVSDLPAATDAELAGFFTLSDNSVKSGNLRVNRSGSVITARFDGTNTTSATISYTITYDDHKNSIVSVGSRINSKPMLSVSSGTNPACAGTPIVLQGVCKDGTGTISSQQTGIATVSSTTATLTATATTLATGEVDFFLTDSDGCKSEYVRVTVNGTPVVTPESPTMCVAVNGTGNTTLISTNLDPATASAWVINPLLPGASLEDVTAGDREARFTITNTALTEQKQFTIEYTSQAGCKGRSVITVNPNPRISPALSTICAAVNNVGSEVALAASQDPGVASAWTINPAGDASLEDVTPTDRLALFRVTNAGLTEQKQFSVEYTGQSGCKATAVIRVNPVPVVAARSESGFDLAKLCAGAPYAEAVTVSGVTTGNWAVYRSGTLTLSTISTQVTTTTAGRGNIQAGNTTASTAVREDVVFISAAACKSNVIPITIHPKPVMSDIADRAYCQNMEIQAFTPTPAGAGETNPTHYQWYLAAEAVNHDDINLSDHTADWTKTAVSGFTTPISTTSLRRDITIKGYNSTSGCVSESQVFTVTIENGLELTFKSTSPICSGTETYVFLNSSLSGTNYSWTVPANNGVGATSQPTPLAPPVIKQSLNNSGSVTYTVTAAAGSCTSTVEIPVTVSSSTVAAPVVSGGANYCVNPEGTGNTFQTNLIPSVAGASAEWVYTSGFPDLQTEVISGNTQKLEKGSVTAVTDNLILPGQAPASVYYIFRPFIECLGSPSEQVLVRIHPVPATPPAIANSAVCSSSTTHATTANIILENSTGLAYTWTVDRTNSADVSGYTEPSREGAVIPTTNPTAATAGPVVDPLVLATTASAAQTIVYSITPWHSGCPGKAVSASIVVNPLPVANKPNDRQYCTGDNVLAETLTGTQDANAFKWNGGLTAGLADQVEYGTGLPAYTAPSPAEGVNAEVKISAKNANGCESAAEVAFNLTVIAKPSLTLGTSQTLCTGPTLATAATARIVVTPGSPTTKYKWRSRADGPAAEGVRYIKNGEDFPFPFEENTPQEGDITQQITATAGSTALITFSVQPFASTCAGDIVTSTVTVTGNNLTTNIVNNSPGVCNGSRVSIKVGDETDGNTYRWAAISNTGNMQGFNQQAEARTATTINDALTLSDTKRGRVTYTITPSRGDCNGAAISHTVFVNPVPVIAVSSEATATICSGARTTILLSTNLNEPDESSRVAYSWIVSEAALGARASTGNSAVFEQQTLDNQGTADGSVTYTFTPHYVSADNNGSCSGLPATMVYTVKPRIGALISNQAEPKKVCLGDEVIILSATAPEGATYQWRKDEADIPDATGNSYTVQTNSVSAATYTVRASIGGGCSVSDSRRVEVSKDEYFTGGEAKADKAEEEAHKPVNFTYTAPNTTGIEYSWDFKDNTAVVTTQNTSHSYLNSGTFLPTLTVLKTGQTACTKTFTLSEIKITPTTGDLNSSIAFSVFPIPAQDQLTIVNEGSDMQNITIRDISGKAVVSKAVYGRKAMLSVGHLASGIYLLSVTDAKGVRHLKISKR